MRLHTFDPTRYALTRGKRAGAATNYLRFYLPELLPRVDKVVWIDADGLVFGDVGQLAEHALVGEHARSRVAAVLRPQKTVTAATGLLAAQLQLLGLSGVSPSAPVFNAGLLVLGLAQWREEHVTLQVVMPIYPRCHPPPPFSHSPGHEHNPLLSIRHATVGVARAPSFSPKLQGLPWHVDRGGQPDAACAPIPQRDHCYAADDPSLVCRLERRGARLEGRWQTCAL